VVERRRRSRPKGVTHVREAPPARAAHVDALSKRPEKPASFFQEFPNIRLQSANFYKLFFGGFMGFQRVASEKKK
jgi:hypothetical protein